MSSTARMNARYAPMNRSHIPGFPNPMPKVDWLEDLPIFKDEKKDNAAFHLVRFHMQVRSLKVHFPEDCLMRMFMATLEGKAWSWYKSLENGSLSSLADFHDVFYDTYKECHPSLLLLKDFCRHSLSLIQYLEDCYDDDEFMDEEILEALHNTAFQHQEERITSHEMQHENQQEFTYENHVQSSNIDEEMQQSSQSSNYNEDESDYTRQEEVLEDSCYNPQAEEKMVHVCNSLQQLASKNDLYNEENYIVCGHHVERQLDITSKEFCVVENQLSENEKCYDDHSFQKVSMTEHKERVLLPFSFTIEEEDTVIEDQFAQPESYKNHQANHVFWDPIAEYVEEFYSPVFQLFYENQKPFQWQWSSQYLIGSELRCSQKTPISDQIDDWLHWKFHVP